MSSSGEFVAPSGMRPRGSSMGPRDPKPRAVVPAPSAAAPAAPGGGDSDDTLYGSRSAPARHDELKLCGLAAVKARFARDPGSIKRLFFDHETGQRVGVICRALAQQKKVYRQVEPAELEKISGSIHHGGIVAVVYAPPLRFATSADAIQWAKKGETVLVLDRIGNAHNLGAIARTAAFFGVPRMVIPDDPLAAKPTDAAHRVAEGGFEQLEVWQTKDLAIFARELSAAGYEVIGATVRGGRPDAPHAKERKPLALLLGNEERGLAADVTAACTRLVTIPGSGKIESLNVSVAAAVLMWELLARR
ncbi:MAG: RNA methyltransferase [Opitutaceae bacterium]